MQITLDLVQLLLSLLVIIGIAVGVVLFIVLIRLIGTLKKVNGLAKDAAVVVAAASQSVPPILKDAQVITGVARSGAEAIGGAARDVNEGVSSFLHSDEEPAMGTFETVIDIIDRVLAIVGLFTGGEKPKRKGGRQGRR